MTTQKNIYTIGHSTIPAARFLHLLKTYLINCIVDVRSMPYSKYAPQFNQEDLKKFLSKHGIKYVSMSQEFGARREDKTLYAPEGYLDFEKVSKSTLFRRGLERVNKGIQNGFRIALMCTEKNAIDCHRSILVARNFDQIGFEVCHISHDGKMQTQKELEFQLLDLYFPRRLEMSLFGEQSDEKNLIIDGYKQRNIEIGYRPNKPAVNYM